MPCAPMRCDGTLPIACPLRTISPETAGRNPNSTFSKVDLPVPFGPSTARISPRSTSTDMPFRMWMPGRYPATRLRAVSSTLISEPGIGTQHLGVVAHVLHRAVGDLLAEVHHHEPGT